MPFRFGARLAALAGVTLSLLALAPPRAASAQPGNATLAVTGGVLIDGHGGPPVHDAVVLVEGTRIVAVGSRGALEPPAGAQVIDAAGMTILPGLIDVHVHLDLLGHASYPEWHATARPRYPEVMEAAARQLLMHGVTTVADLVGDSAALAATIGRIERGEIPGPRVRASMGWIMNWPEAQYEAHHRYGQLSNVGTVEEARAAARLAIERGAGIIKVHNGLTPDQMRAIAGEARRAGLRVTGHVGDRHDLLARIAAGQDGIEHIFLASGTRRRLHPDIVEGLLDEGTYVVPTMIQTMIQERAVEWPDWRNNPRARAMTPPDLWAEIRRSIDDPKSLPYFGGGVSTQRMDNVGTRIRQMWEAGVRLLIGTDAGTVMNFSTDATWQEMDLMAGYGVPPMEVIVMATRHNADYLGMGDEVGTVAPGKLADIIVVDGNPLLSMRDLRHVAVVIKGGTVYRNEL